jgi:hypothetical protein
LIVVLRNPLVAREEIGLEVPAVTGRFVRAHETIKYSLSRDGGPFVFDKAPDTFKARGLDVGAYSTCVVGRLIAALHDARVELDNVATLQVCIIV